MSEKKVLMHFDPNGGVKVEAQGYEGGTCMEATKPFEELFSKQVGEREMVGACGPTPTQGESVL